MVISYVSVITSNQFHIGEILKITQKKAAQHTSKLCKIVSKKDSTLSTKGVHVYPIPNIYIDVLYIFMGTFT